MTGEKAKYGLYVQEDFVWLSGEVAGQHNDKLLCVRFGFTATNKHVLGVDVVGLHEKIVGHLFFLPNCEFLS